MEAYLSFVSDVAGPCLRHQLGHPRYQMPRDPAAEITGGQNAMLRPQRPIL